MRQHDTQLQMASNRREVNGQDVGTGAGCDSLAVSGSLRNVAGCTMRETAE